MTLHRVGVINVPIKVGPRKWAACWRIMARRTGVFGVNESLSRRQRLVYAALTTSRHWGQYGLWASPNPIFWNRETWRKVPGSGAVIKLHDAGPWAHDFPGYNASRYATVVTLERRRSKIQHTIICTHLVSDGAKNPRPWRIQVRETSTSQLRNLVDGFTDNGNVVWLFGDMNIKAPFPMGRRFHWVRGVGIDKVGVAVPRGYHEPRGTFTLPPAPTDHKHGLVAHVELTKEKP